MKTLARWGLKLLSLVVPVTMAACYGMPADFGKSQCGTVRDSATQTGVAGIQVTCLQADQEIGMAYTQTDGAFCVSFSETAICESLQVEDVDGEENGGTYQATSATPPADGSSLTIDLTK